VWRFTVLDPGVSASLSGDTGSFDMTLAADENNGLFFTGQSIDVEARLVNLGSPYPVTINVAYTSEIDDQGSIDGDGANSLTLLINDTNFNVVNYGVNGTVTGTLVDSGTVGYGYNNFRITASAFAGGNFSLLPATAFNHFDGSIVVTPATAP